MTLSPKLSVIIVSWNTAQLLRRCLASLVPALASVPHEIIVVDNGSSDGSPEMVAERFPDSILIRNRHNEGFARAGNRGMRAARGTYILLLNSDTEVESSAVLSRWVSFMDERPEAGASGCRLVLPDGRHQVGDAGCRPCVKTLFNYALFLSLLFPRRCRGMFVSRVPGNDALPVDWVCGAALMVRRDILERTGLLDEAVFMYAEDIEWGCRIKSCGYSIYYLPFLRIVHLHGASTKKRTGDQSFGSLWLENIRKLYGRLNPAGSIRVFDLLMTAAFLLRAAAYGTLFCITMRPRFRAKAIQVYGFLRSAIRCARLSASAPGPEAGFGAAAAPDPAEGGGPEISVIIPTYNRAPIIEKCLRALEAQDYPAHRFEVIVADDGSEDDTLQKVMRRASEADCAVRYLRQPNSGANAARNKAVREAAGRLLLFINDDTIADPALVSCHERCHRQHPGEATAVLGRVTISPDVPPSIFSRLHLDGCFAQWEGRRELDWRAFYTCNVSVKKSFLMKYGMFEERLRYHEDIELAERLSRHGLKVIYSPDALGLHCHSLSEQEYLRVAERDGRALAHWYMKSPHLKKKLSLVNFSPGAAPMKRLKHAAGDMIINRLTMNMICGIARYFSSRNESVALYLYAKAYESIKRGAVRKELKNSMRIYSQ